MSAITTHVLDTSRGRPAAGVAIELETRDASGAWRRIGHGATDAEGRLRTLMGDAEPLLAGSYRLVFDVEKYFRAQGVATFYPQVTVEFRTTEGDSHYHVPLLLSPFGFSTYRGS
jgi:5-hydroxyisourate hydrolase